MNSFLYILFFTELALIFSETFSFHKFFQADNGDTFVKEEIREKQCPICFLEIVDETRTDACRHRFCF